MASWTIKTKTAWNYGFCEWMKTWFWFIKSLSLVLRTPKGGVDPIVTQRLVLRILLVDQPRSKTGWWSASALRWWCSAEWLKTWYGSECGFWWMSHCTFHETIIITIEIISGSFRVNGDCVDCDHSCDTLLNLLSLRKAEKTVIHELRPPLVIKTCCCSFIHSFIERGNKRRNKFNEKWLLPSSCS